MIVLLFAVFAVFQVMAAPGLYDRYFQDKARELSGKLIYSLFFLPACFLVWTQWSVWKRLTKTFEGSVYCTVLLHSVHLLKSFSALCYDGKPE